MYSNILLRDKCKKHRYTDPGIWILILTCFYSLLSFYYKFKRRHRIEYINLDEDSFMNSICKVKQNGIYLQMLFPK